MINKKIIISIILILIFSIASLGCVEEQPRDKDRIYEKNISFETIAVSFHSGYEENKTYVIKQEQEWNSLRGKLQVSLPDINFTQYMVIAAFQGSRRTGGYSIKITEIIEDQDKVTVYITETSPRPEDIVIQVLTDPLHIVKLERSEKSILFNITQTISDIERYEKNISFETIAVSFHSGYEENKTYVIRQKQEWNSLRGKLRVSLPDINFTQYMVIAAFQGSRNTGGYSIRITDIIGFRDNITIYITETSPRPDDMVIQVLTDPFHIVKLERNEKNILFNITQTIRQ